MAKKASKPAVSRKVKRSVRKTFGVLALVMALIVAAIPTPSASAIGGSDSDTSVPAQTYPTNPALSNDPDITPISYTDSTVYNAKMIYQTSAGNYELWNAYEFHTVGVTGGSKSGVITKYNPVFTPQNGTLTINSNVVTNYPSYTIEEINAFYDTPATGDVALTDAEIERYYPSEWSSYVSAKDSYDKEYTAWVTKHDQWIANGSPEGKEPIMNSSEPTKPSYQAKNLSYANRMIYFCDHYKNSDVTKNLEPIHGQEYGLVEVVDKTITNTGVGSSVVYIPFNRDRVSGDDISSGFYAPSTNKFDIKYIGDNSFAGATNITKLVIPQEILQIGDSAFEGASGIQEVTAYSGTIGNRAFKDCASLKSVTIGNGTTVIGTECFYGCNRLSSITFPSTIAKIGKGAFAFCASLANIDMSGINSNLIIDDYGFYDCYALRTVEFCDLTSRIGEAAFAVESGLSGAWTNVVLPASVSKLGDYVLAGRSNLKTVVMPENYGLQNTETLGSGFFRGCINLEWVEFPDTKTGSCGYVDFATKAFIDVLTQDFYVRGPENNAAGVTASPRKSAWAAGITYVYNGSDGKDHWEVGSGIYRFTVDDYGVLTSCVLVSDSAKNEFTSSSGNDGLVVVPAKVGEIVVTGIGPECFSMTTDDVIYQNLKTLKIEDGSAIASIDNEAFKDMPKLETVYVGNSVQSIGDGAFMGCNKLETVVFSTPKNGYSGFTIGTNAFATGSDDLTFYGDIVKGYAPFTWAMDPDNYMDQPNQKRVCYRSGTPEKPNLTVLLNNDTNQVTLVDYPHYDELSDDIRTKYEKYLSGNYNDNSEIALDAEQAEQLGNVLNVIIPEGIESIDVKAYIASTNNSYNVQSYMANDQYYTTYRQYGLFNGYYGKNTGTDGKREYDSGNELEKVDRGNDRILSVTMSSVRSLPDNAFFSCENLQSVTLGSALEDIGTAPFSGCDNLTGVGGNDKYICSNGIIYENNDTGKTIIECLSSRGDGVGSSYIDAETDPDIKNVTKISDGAFENCGSIMSVDLSEASGLQVIPNNCFDGDENLITVILPDSVNEINKGAFTNTRKYLSVTIPAKEVAIATDAFDDVAILRSYTGSAVETYANMNGHQFQEINKNYLVYFLDYDGTEIDLQYVEEGKAAVEPEKPTRSGYVFSEWSAPFTNITKDTIIVAKYVPAPTSTVTGTVTPAPTTKPGSTTGTVTPTPSRAATSGTPTPTPSGQFKLTVKNGSGSGSYKAGATVSITANAAPTGQVFKNWTSASNDFNIAGSTSSVTTITMPSHDLTITANYESSSANNSNTSGSNNTNTNNGSSNASGNSTSNAGGSTNTGVQGSNTGTTVDITKPGISNTGIASATVDGSTDNFVVKITDSDSARAAVEAALRKEYGSLDNLSYFAMDISLYDSTGTTKIEDTTGLSVNITMPIPDDLIQYAGNNQVAGVVNGDTLDKLNPRFLTINGVPCVSFTATHFSPYTVYVDRSNLTSGVTDNTPKTGDPIHPKWFLVIALGCTSAILLLKKDRGRVMVKKA